MKLKQAIKIINTIYNDIDVGQPDDDLDALKLGIEAIKEVERLRETALRGIWLLLPGETKN